MISSQEIRAKALECAVLLLTHQPESTSTYKKVFRLAKDMENYIVLGRAPV